MSLAMDGADQSCHDLPKVIGRVPKDIAAWPQKLQAVVSHGQLLVMFNVLNIISGGANMAVTCLMRALQLTLLEGVMAVQRIGPHAVRHHRLAVRLVQRSEDCHSVAPTSGSYP